MKSILIHLLCRLTAVLLGLFIAPLLLICGLGMALSKRKPLFVRHTDDQNQLTSVHFNFPRGGGLARFCRETQLHLLPEMWLCAAGSLRLPLVLRHLMERARER